jgi:hypothetical protein
MSIILLTSVLPLKSVYTQKLAIKEIKKNDDRLYILQVQELILKVALDTAKAITSYQYKKFDALVKNFGCQMTALEVYNIFKDNNLSLQRESEEICEQLSVILKDVELQQTNLSKRQVVTMPNLDIEISALFLKCMRFRLLAIINDNKAYGEIEQPITNCDKIIPFCEPPKKAFEAMIKKLQEEEAEAAALFIQTVPSVNNPQRKSLIDDMLMETHLINKIVSLPLMYNTEAVLTAFNGLLLIKNKLTFCGKPNERKPIKVYMKLPENEVVDEKTIERSKVPILVIEGYIKKRDNLLEAINSIGLISIVNANCASLPQFIGKSPPEINNSEAKSDIARYVALEKENQIRENILDIDHFYAASLDEEYGEAT